MKKSGLAAALGREVNAPQRTGAVPYQVDAAGMPQHPGHAHGVPGPQHYGYNPHAYNPHAYAPHGYHPAPNGMHPMPPERIDGNFPAGVYQDGMSNPMAPFMGGHQMPNGQMINVSMNAPSQHLPFWQWAGRGALAATGNAVAWAPRLVGRLIEEVMKMFIGIFGKLLLVLLIPMMLVIGIKMAAVVQTYDSVEGGAAQVVHQGRHAINGLQKGLNDDLPPEKTAKDDAKKIKKKADRDAD